MNRLFEEKARAYRSKPNHIKAVKYEKGMENGWIVQFYGIDSDFGNNFKIFDTEEEALDYYNNKPLQTITTHYGDNREEVVEYEVEYEKPKPCLWHNETREITDFGYKWVEQVYEIIEEDSWIMQWGGIDELGIYNDSYMKSDWELDE